MPLQEGQAQLRDLVVGPGTPYRWATLFNPMSRNVRANQGGERPWADGSWSGAEWAEQIAIPMRLIVHASGQAEWMRLHQQLLAAFAPSHQDLPLTFCIGGVEYVMFGRPRMVEPQSRHLDGHGYTNTAFIALDPTVYSGAEHQVVLGLPSTTGGLTLPLTVPVTIDATVTSGRQMISNAGTKTTGLTLRVNGPVVEPRVSVLTPDGTAIVRVWLTLTAGQWLDIDTASRTVYLNGTASRRGLTTAEGAGWPVLPTGAWEVAFDSPSYDPDARLTVSWRDAWH
ncbi:hypothetical protein [Micromonospora sp. NPDC050200]|uniref:phage distal tail protein n=1 Tax=Micromonospora sp. NPDC050200 TaxID=3155664 RepID=UPI0034104AFE